VGVYVLIRRGVRLIFALVLGVSVALAMAVTWIAAARMRRKIERSGRGVTISSPPPVTAWMEWIG